MGTTSTPESFLIENYFEEFIVGQPFTVDPLVIRGTGAGSFRIERDACSNVFLDIGDDCEFDVVFSPPWDGAQAAQGGDPGTVLGRMTLTGPNADQFSTPTSS